METAPSDEPRRRRLPAHLDVTAVAALPLAVAVIVLLWRPWAPTLDMAMTELRVRDVGGGDTPMIGLPGRIGNFPDQGSHPGPLSFYLLAPFYRLAGASAWGLELGSVVVNALAIGGTVTIGARLAGRRGAIAVAALCAVAVRGYGLNVLTHPWNPYFPVLIWLLVLVAAWAAVSGDHWSAVVVVAAGSVAAQTHVPYLLNGLAISALVYGVMIWRWTAARRDGHSVVGHVEVGRPLVCSLLVGAGLWLPPVIDQLVRDPGNIRMLYRHFAVDPPEAAIGSGEAVRVFFRHLDAFSLAGDLVLRQSAFVYRSGLPGGTGWGGVVVFAAWIAAVVLAWRRRHRLLGSLNAVIAVGLVVQAFSISRIFGKVWYYLTLWAWGTTLLVVVSIAWTVALEVGARRDRRIHEGIVRPVAIVGLAATLASVGAAFRLDVPEPQLSDGLRAVLPATVGALERGDGALVGPDGRYVVFWQDAAYNGSQGYGLVNELERRGFDVGVRPAWRVPVTQHRVIAPDDRSDAELHLVTGVFIERWRARPGYTEIIEYDRRTDDERVRFAELRERVIAGIGDLDRPEHTRSGLISKVDENLFGASLEPGLPQQLIDDMSEMLLLSVPIAVFVAPPGSTE